MKVVIDKGTCGGLCLSCKGIIKYYERKNIKAYFS